MLRPEQIEAVRQTLDGLAALDARLDGLGDLPQTLHSRVEGCRGNIGAARRRLNTALAEADTPEPREYGVRVIDRTYGHPRAEGLPDTSTLWRVGRDIDDIAADAARIEAAERRASVLTPVAQAAQARGLALYETREPALWRDNLAYEGGAALFGALPPREDCPGGRLPTPWQALVEVHIHQDCDTRRAVRWVIGGDLPEGQLVAAPAGSGRFVDPAAVELVGEMPKF
jgi:hypothetical protein